MVWECPWTGKCSRLAFKNGWNEKITFLVLTWDGSNKLGISLFRATLLNRECIGFESMIEFWLTLLELVSMLIAESSSNIMISSSSLLVVCCSISIFWFCLKDNILIEIKNQINKNQLSTLVSCLGSIKLLICFNSSVLWSCN